jgi:ubiquinone/menaquinone biosynthesis C-methylase UbiE
MASKGLRERFRPGIQDFIMRSMDELRAETVGAAVGTVLEVGFGTGRNLEYYGAGVEKLNGLDPMNTHGVRAVEERIARARFQVERALHASFDDLPFDAGHFDSIVTTWTLCSIREPVKALGEMRRLLKPGGRYLFIEHGRSPSPRTQRWQDRLNPIWRCLMGGCNINRHIDRLIEDAGFSLVSLDRFQHKGPALLAHMYRGVAT